MHLTINVHLTSKLHTMCANNLPLIMQTALEKVNLQERKVSAMKARKTNTNGKKLYPGKEWMPCI